MQSFLLSLSFHCKTFSFRIWYHYYSFVGRGNFFFCVPFDIWLNDTRKKNKSNMCCHCLPLQMTILCRIIFSRSQQLKWIDFFIGFFHVNAFFFATRHSIFPDWHSIWIDAFETVHGLAKWFLHRLTSISIWSSISEFAFFFLLIDFLSSSLFKSSISLFFFDTIRCEVI